MLCFLSKRVYYQAHSTQISSYSAIITNAFHNLWCLFGQYIIDLSTVLLYWWHTDKKKHWWPVISGHLVPVASWYTREFLVNVCLWLGCIFDLSGPSICVVPRLASNHHCSTCILHSMHIHIFVYLFIFVKLWRFMGVIIACVAESV